MEKNNYLSVKIKLGAAEFEAEGSTDDVVASRDSFLGFIKECSESLSLLRADQKTIASTSQDTTIDAEESKRPISKRESFSYSSFNEMKRALGLCSNTDLVMGAACFLSMHDSKEVITSQDIKGLLQKTKNKTKINISQFIAQNISKGLLEEVGLSDKKQKEYQVLDSAHEWLQGLESGRKQATPNFAS